MKHVWLGAFLMIAGLAVAQQTRGTMIALPFAGAPTGTCPFYQYFAVDTTTGDFYDCFSGTWTKVNGSGGGAVSSVFTRTGAVVAVSGDYTVAQITGAAPLASPTFTGTVSGITATMVGLGSVTNDVQTKAAIVPNTAPSAAQVLAGNAGGTAYAPVSISGDSTMTSAGVMTNQKINGTLLSGLGTGILKNTTGTGVPSIAVGSDLPTAIPIASVGSAGLSGTAPITISAAGAIACANCVNATSPGAGIAHFAGSTQTVTSSAIVDADLSGQVGVAHGGTNLASGTSGGVLCYTASGTLSSSAALTANVMVKGGGAGVCPGNSLLTDTGTTATYTGTGGLAAPVFTATGTTAGFTDYPQGTTSVAVAPCNTATSICEQAPASVTSYLVNKPGVAAGGTLIGTNTSAVITQGFSGDANHSATVTIGSGTSIGSTSLCSTTFCPVGTYRVNVYVDITTACGTTGTYLVNLIYTDDQGSKTVPVNLSGTGAVPATGVLTTTSTANFGQDSFILRSTGGASINYSTTAVACGTAGPMVGKLYMAVEPLM